MSPQHTHKEHSQSDGHGHHHPHVGQNILVAFLLNFGFAIFELIGGIYTGSAAILADAVHDFGDSLSLGISLILEKLSIKKKTDRYTYGYRRLSLLSSLIAGIVISVGSGIVLYEAIPQFWNKETPPNGPAMIVIALVGLSVNGFAAFRLSKGKSRNESMLSWHLVEDVLGWAAVLLGAIVITITSWTWIDPLLACGVAFFVLFNVTRNLWKTIEIFLQRKPEGFDELKFKQEVLKIQNVSHVRDLHVWSIDGDTNILSVTIAARSGFNFEDDFAKLKNTIREITNSFGKYHTTIEVESESEIQNQCEF